jgi:hypothetical protein
MTSDREKELARKKFLAMMWRPAIYILINFFLINTLFSLLPSGLGDVLYNLGRISIIFYAGWLVIRKGMATLWYAALAGMFLYFVDHVLLKGGVFLLNYLLKPEGPGLAAYVGAVVSFIMFTPLAMSVGAMGGFFARSRKAGATIDPL